MALVERTPFDVQGSLGRMIADPRVAEQAEKDRAAAAQMQARTAQQSVGNQMLQALMQNQLAKAQMRAQQEQVAARIAAQYAQMNLQAALTREGRQAQTDEANAQRDQQAMLQQQSLGAQMRMQQAGFWNQQAMQQAGFDQQTAMQNATLGQQWNMQQAGFDQQTKLQGMKADQFKDYQKHQQAMAEQQQTWQGEQNQLRWGYEAGQRAMDRALTQRGQDMQWYKFQKEMDAAALAAKSAAERDQIMQMRQAATELEKAGLLSGSAAALEHSDVMDTMARLDAMGLGLAARQLLNSPALQKARQTYADENPIEMAWDEVVLNPWSTQPGVADFGALPQVQQFRAGSPILPLAHSSGVQHFDASTLPPLPPLMSQQAPGQAQAPAFMTPGSMVFDADLGYWVMPGMGE